MKVGININIDVTKIDKARLVKGKKGTYLDLTTFVDLDNQDQHGNNGFVSHRKAKGEEGNTPILGNVRVFWTGEGQNQQQRQPNPPQSNDSGFNDDFDDDIPF